MARLLIILAVCISLCSVAADNYHTAGVKRVVCNETDLNVNCTGSRWKISYLGTDEEIEIDETSECVYITGAVQTAFPTIYKDKSIVYPAGYRIILHSDTVYNGVPEKIIAMCGAIVLTIITAFLAFPKLEGFFRREEKMRKE
ncbi:hypothetical protein NEAUS03_0906 [Nematocida ausubeli]|nr:hypothetical protein NEAUS03_0906 [Nematocida ausubeli]